MRIGDTVKIRECDSIPEVVGQNGEIVDMEIQHFAKYTVYPIWVKMTSGERAGEVYGFREGEVELLPKVSEARAKSSEEEVKAVKPKELEKVKESLAKVATVEEIAEVERVIEEAKGKIMVEPSMGFWEEKTPCWEMFRCPEAVRNECPAFNYRSLPCWEIEGTYCKLDDYAARGDDTSICQVCRVYKRWGGGKPIQIKLFGKGIDTSLRSVEKGRAGVK